MKGLSQPSAIIFTILSLSFYLFLFLTLMISISSDVCIFPLFSFTQHSRLALSLTMFLSSLTVPKSASVKSNYKQTSNMVISFSMYVSQPNFYLCSYLPPFYLCSSNLQSNCSCLFLFLCIYLGNTFSISNKLLSLHLSRYHLIYL